MESAGCTVRANRAAALSQAGPASGSLLDPAAASGRSNSPGPAGSPAQAPIKTRLSHAFAMKPPPRGPQGTEEGANIATRFRYSHTRTADTQLYIGATAALRAASSLGMVARSGPKPGRD